MKPTPCSAGPPARTSRSSARSGERPRRSAGCGPRSRTHDRPSPSSRCRSTHTSDSHPNIRSVRSSPITTDGSVLSRNGTTTRNRDHASHAQNNTVRAPAILGPIAIVPLHPQPRLRDPRPRPPPVLAAATGAWPPRPPAASCAPNPDTPSRPASHAPDRPGSARASDRPAHRSSPRTGPPAAAAAHAPAARRPPPPAPRPNARPSCDHTPPAPPPHAASPSSHTPQGSPSLPPASSRPASSDRASTTTRARVPAPQDRTVGRNRGHPWGETVATSGEIQWPPMGRFPWPPSLLPGSLRRTRRLPDCGVRPTSGGVRRS